MGQCFVPDCYHHSESHNCHFFKFPSKLKRAKEYKSWIRLIRRKDREPTQNSRVCSCHFREGNKSNGPEISAWNENKLFPSTEKKKPNPVKRKLTDSPAVSVQDMVKAIQESNENINNAKDTTQKPQMELVILQAELDSALAELKKLKAFVHYERNHYTVSSINTETVRMETGLPTKEVFDIVVWHVIRFKDDIKYYSGWKVESIKLEDQIFIALMKIKQNYTNLHLAQLFSCSDATIANINLTFLYVLHSLLFTDIMTTIPSRDKNKTCAPSSFSQFSSCRIVIDCTDIEVSTPGLMKDQKVTYSSYRSMNSFKVIVGVAPNGVITYVSKLYPGSISEKEITEKSGLLRHLVAGDLILADKGFLINDIVPHDVAVNIPPFLNNGKFTESEARATKSIAKCRIHVERANARLKDFKILSFIPSYLRCHVDELFQLCAALVNLQFPLIKEGCEGTERFE